MNLINLTVDKFVKTTASEQPVPGGGSISALCGSLAAALSHMVASLTIGKKKYIEVQDEMQQLVTEMSPKINELMAAVDKDSEAYDMVFQAYKLPKETEDEKAKRTEAIQKALRHAASVPLSVAEMSASLFPAIETLSEKGNQNAVTDAYVAALCARTAVLGACANVRINLMSITDDKFVDKTMRTVVMLEHEANEAEARISKTIHMNI